MQYLLFYKRKKDLSRCAGMERIMQMDMDVNIVIYQKHRWVRTDLQLLLARRRDIMPIKRARVFSVQWWLSNIEYSDCSTRTCILGTYNTFMDCERTIGTGIDINTIGIHINKYVSKVCARPRHILFVLQINLHHGSWIFNAVRWIHTGGYLSAASLGLYYARDSSTNPSFFIFYCNNHNDKTVSMCVIFTLALSLFILNTVQYTLSYGSSIPIN